MESKKFIFILTLLLVAFFSETSACGSRRGRHHGRGHSSGHHSWGFGSLSSHHHHSSSYHPSSSWHSSGYSGGSSYNSGGSGYDSRPSHTSSGAEDQNLQNDLYPEVVEEQTTTTTTTTTAAPVKEDVSWLQLSCQERLCEFTKNYPLEEVESAVEEITKVLRTGSSSSDVNNDINQNVMDFFVTSNTKVDDVKIDNSTECKEEPTAISPLGGYDINGKPFIIVNVPKLSQEVKSIKCRAYDFCKKDVWTPLPWLCAQSFREEELLVLPAKQGSFNPTEFSVKTFKVPNGCECLAMNQALNIHG